MAGNDRGPDWQKNRKAALLRDNNQCQKCHRRASLLDVHHKVPRVLGGTNDLDNLVSLCRPCHLEWEGVSGILDLSFEDWLPLPSAYRLITMLLTEDAWSEEMTAKEVRQAILQSNNFLIAVWDAEEEEPAKETKRKRQRKAG